LIRFAAKTEINRVMRLQQNSRHLYRRRFSISCVTPA